MDEQITGRSPGVLRIGEAVQCVSVESKSGENLWARQTDLLPSLLPIRTRGTVMVDDRIRKILAVTREKHIEKAFADRPARSPESLERTNFMKHRKRITFQIIWTQCLRIDDYRSILNLAMELVYWGKFLEGET
jgi:hypothetical protein